MVVRIPQDRVTDINDSRSNARMGGQNVLLTESRLSDIYQGARLVHERHGNRYEIVDGFAEALKEKGFVFTGCSEESGYPESFEVPEHPFYIGVIYHPEFVSRPTKAHPLFSSFISAAMA